MKLFESVYDIDISKDIWQLLAESDKPIVMYGMGNGADKIIEALSFFGLEVADFFASDGFVRGQSFHSKTVLTFKQICEKYSDFNIVVSFGTKLPEVLENIYSLDSKYELFIPDVPVVCEELKNELFTLEYFKKHIDRLAMVCESLSDIRSKRTFCDIIAYRLTGKLEYLRWHTVEPDEVYNDILKADEIKYTADLGAYNGDSVRELAKYSKPDRVIALEPDARNFRKLSEFSATVEYRIDCVNAAAWNADCELSFTAGGNRNSTLSTTVGLKTGAKLKTVSARRLDSVFDELFVDRLDYIKYDVEGAEREALEGSRNVIERFRPKLLVSLYHRTEDIFSLPEYVRSLGYKKLYLRRYEYIPAWDINLIAE